MDASSNTTDQARQLGQEEQDMNIFGNQECHFQVIHVGNKQKATGVCTTRQYNNQQYRYNRHQRHWKYHNNTYYRSGSTHKKKYREKTIEDYTQNQKQPYQLSNNNYLQQKNNQYRKNSFDGYPQTKVEQTSNPKPQVDVAAQKLLQEPKLDDSIVIQQNGSIFDRPIAQLKPLIPSQDQDEQIEIIQLKNEKQVSHKLKKRPKKQIIASLPANQEIQLVEINHNRKRIYLLQSSNESAQNHQYKPFSFVKELQQAINNDDKSSGQARFYAVEVIILYKGPIITLKIKGITVGQYSKKEIKIEKSSNNKYKCEEKYSHLIQIEQNVYQGRKEYNSTFKQAKFQLCKIKLPTSSRPRQNIYTKEHLSACPILINKISIKCICSHKYETALSSEGVTCSNSNCTLPSEFTIKSITFKLIS